MRINFCILLTITLISALFTQGQTWRELNPPPNIFNDAINSVATDSLDNVYAAGKFKNSNNKFIVARWFGGHWSELGAGVTSLNASNVIFALTVDRSNNLYAAGAFYNSSGNYYVAKWNGTSWSQLGTGANALNPNGAFYTIMVDRSNNVYAAGGFTNSGGKRYVAKWNGTNWSELGTGSNALSANGPIYSIATDSIGNIYAAGHFTNSSGNYYVAKWNGSSWTEIGGANTLNANDYINSIQADNSGNVFAAGAFRNSSNEYYVAKFNGNSWAEIGSGVNAIHANGAINTITINSVGNIYAAGYGTNINGGTNVMKWNGTSWNQVCEVGAGTNTDVKSLVLDYAGNLYGGGDFKNAGQHNYVAKWNGTVVKELGRQGEILPSSNQIQVVRADIFGRVYAVGDFWNTPGNPIVAMWDGIGWKPLKNTTYPSYVEMVNTITTDLAGNIYAAGFFTNASGECYVAKWNGSNWDEVTNPATPLHATGQIRWLATDSSGNIYASGNFDGHSIAKWNGSTWTKFGPPSQFNCIVQAPAGSVYVSDPSSVGGNTVYQMSPSFMNVLSGLNAFNSVYSLAIDHNNGLYAAGYFSYVRKWNGSTWSTLGTIPNASLITSLTADSLTVYAAIHAGSYFYVGKWNGSSWIEFGPPYYFGGQINSLYKDDKNNFYAGGIFSGYTGHPCVSATGTSLLILEQPVVAPSPSQYCSSSGIQSIKILNLPDTSRIHVLVKLDSTTLNINSDSSFSFNVSTLSFSNHRIKVSFFIGVDTIFTTSDFNVTAAVTPDVNLSANTTVVTTLNPVVITATNASGGGASPLFTFAKNHSITNILQAESSNNILNLNSASLITGSNWIYCRMKTSDSCYWSQTNIDSINITLSTTTGIIDLDFPEQKINVAPVPFKNSFTITGLQSFKSYTISLINAAGQILMDKQIHNRMTFTVEENFPVGIYFLKVVDKSKNHYLGTIKLIRNE